MKIPRPLTEVYAETRNKKPRPPDQQVFTFLELAIPIAKMVAQMRKAFKNQVVPNTTLQALEQQLDSIALSWPELLQPTASSYLDPNLLRVATAFSCMSLLLHRHNLNPASSLEERNAALEACLHAAQTTAQLVNRTFQPPPTVQSDGYTDPARASLSWEQRVASTTPAHLCSDLWRCTLILCLCLDIDSAITCVRFSAAIGSRRRINVACSRNLKFFLTQITNRLNQQTSPPDGSRSGMSASATSKRPPRIDQDEEMIAYATGDLQGDARSSWVWTSGETDTSGASSDNAGGRNAGGDQNMDPSPRADEEVDEWPRVMSMLQSLRPYQQQRPPQLSSGGSSGESRSRSGYSPGSSKRISIANII